MAPMTLVNILKLRPVFYVKTQKFLKDLVCNIKYLMNVKKPTEDFKSFKVKNICMLHVLISNWVMKINSKPVLCDEFDEQKIC